MLEIQWDFSWVGGPSPGPSNQLTQGPAYLWSSLWVGKVAGRCWVIYRRRRCPGIIKSHPSRQWTLVSSWKFYELDLGEAEWGRILAQHSWFLGNVPSHYAHLFALKGLSPKPRVDADAQRACQGPRQGALLTLRAGMRQLQVCFQGPQGRPTGDSDSSRLISSCSGDSCPLCSPPTMPTAV